jgi:hypothetical protein
MRETRLSGSEGGAEQLMLRPYPYRTPSEFRHTGPAFHPSSVARFATGWQPEA